MHFMVIERSRAGARPVYERFGERGRLMPDGLDFVASWVSADLGRVFQVMECDGITLLQAPGVMADISRSGPFHDLAHVIEVFIEDRTRTAVALVTLPEELHTGSPREASCPEATATSRPQG